MHALHDVEAMGDDPSILPLDAVEHVGTASPEEAERAAADGEEPPFFAVVEAEHRQVGQAHHQPTVESLDAAVHVSLDLDDAH
jgi:hypothetical protein